MLANVKVDFVGFIKKVYYYKGFITKTTYKERSSMYIPRKKS